MRKDAEALHDPYWEHAGDELARARFHDLRHTHATELLRAGVHIKVVAERLGDRRPPSCGPTPTCCRTCRSRRPRRSSR